MPFSIPSMSSEVISQAVFGGPSFDNYSQPLSNTPALPAAYVTANRPHKRIRLGASLPTQVDTNSNNQRGWERLGSAHSANGIFSEQQVNVQSEEEESQRPQSVPPHIQRGRKKKSTQSRQEEPWIQESFAFPAQQTWLKVKPRHRKVAVEVATAEQVAVPASVAPDVGEALSLDKHADRIAALIAQKRRENDSKLFRERMSLQQRLHRGEADYRDKLIAASHDELKRKMELSAKGIFEEQPPSGREPALTPDTQHVAISYSPSQLSNAAEGEACPATVPPTYLPPTLLETGAAENEASLQGMGNVSEVNEELSNSEEDESDIEDQTSPNEPPEPPYIHQAATVITPSGYTSYGQATYHQTRTAIATQTFALSNAPSQHQATQFFLTQPRFTNQRYHNPDLYQPQLEQDVLSQLWTSQMFKALPSTSTPVLDNREIATNTQLISVDEDNSIAFNPFRPPQTSDFPRSRRGSGLLSDDVRAAGQPQPVVLRSNVNMFTRQARENGVIGGNNNYLEMGAETGRRKNMFDSRT